ncbi:MAG: putative lipid II flippase FtsW [marine bacterium B5-7]|nr:MAG: putative lipid II flippase FtsW [marine bacterium B5-7]
MTQLTPQRPSALAFDHWLVISVLAIMAMGVLMVTSASMVISAKQYGNSFHYAVHQLLYLFMGISVALVVLRVKMETWERISPWLVLVSFILLLAVLVPGIGRSVNGSRRWINLLVINVQVSEVVKLCMILFMSGYLIRRQKDVSTTIGGFLRPMGLIGVMGLLLLLEPDFGATVVIMATALSLLFLAGMRFRHFAGLLLIVAIAMAVLAISSPYRLQRLTTFLNPWARQFDSGYQLTQSLIAFGRGGWTGVGLGESIQKLFYLPEAHTDFLFAVLAEELGFVGEMVVLGLFSFLVYRILRIGRRAHRINQVFAAFCCYGFALWIAFQVMINIGVCSGVLPTKGLTLPFMSYGGSSLMVMCVVIAIVLRVDSESRQ